MRFMILAGFFAGSAAGVKYTGWIVPLALGAYLLVACRPRVWTIPFAFASVLGGVLPLARNFVWTGDPFFPFLSRRLHPNTVNGYALDSLIQDARSSGFSLAPLHLLCWPISLSLQGENYGLGQYFGPIVLAFAPLLLFINWKSQTAKLAGVVWASMFLANALTAQMGRFLLPVYMLALALAFSGLAVVAEFKWRALVYGCVGTVVIFIAFAGASDLLYARDFLPVTLGLET
ncbi:MAG: hypothetical protein WBE97_14405 [Candidatus Acidiferrales bacterium]